MHYELGCSSTLGVYLFFLHAFAVLAIAISPLHNLFSIILMPLVVLHFFYERQRYSQHRLIIIEKDADDNWNCVYADEQHTDKLRLQGSLLLQSLIIIYLRHPSYYLSRPVLIFPDMLSEDAFRRLSVYLRHVNLAAQ